MPELTLTRRPGQNQFFDQELAPGVLLRLMQIPAGSFLMGSPADEPDRRNSEGPQHPVTLPEFFMGKYPVTQAQWRAIAALPQIERQLDPDPSRFEGDTRPVEHVSWDDAVEFCHRLSRQSGWHYRLPSEAEWEYACRAATTTPFHFGETITTEVANYRGTNNESMGWSGSYGRGPLGEYRRETTPVDHFGIANAFGLCDMHGNVWEWCADHWHDNYEEAPDDRAIWPSSDKNSERIIRGGSWLISPRNCRSASRSRNYRDDADDFFGFRVVCAAP